MMWASIALWAQVEERRPPVPEFFVAFLATALLLFVLCNPSRKS